MDSKLVLYLIAVLVFAFLMSYAATPLVRRLSKKVGAIDIPKDERRMHSEPIPTMGGLAIFISFAIGVLFFVPMEKTYSALLLGAVVIVVIGMLDDIFELKWWVKLLGQIFAALIVALNGILITDIGNGAISFGIFAIPVTVLWIVLITNTINLIDGLDGLACGIAAISCVTLLVVSTFSVSPENQSVMFVIAILAGACFGFLPFNMNPAKIFMGDTGAMFIGYALSVISIQGFFKLNALVSFGVPFLVLALPIMDTLFAFMRRVAKGQSFFRPDKKHLHHRMIDWGFNQRQTVWLYYAICALLGVAAVLFALPERRFLLGIIVMIAAFATGIILINIMAKKNKNENNTDELNTESFAKTDDGNGDDDNEG